MNSLDFNKMFCLNEFTSVKYIKITKSTVNFIHCLRLNGVCLVSYNAMIKNVVLQKKKNRGQTQLSYTVTEFQFGRSLLDLIKLQ